VALLAALGCAAPAAKASLGVPTGGPPTSYFSLAAFEAAAGGADNRTTAGEQGAGFRHVDWDAIAVNGRDPGSTAIPGGHTAAVSRSRLQPWGLELGPEIAVADDGFHSVNGSASFTPFSAPNVWGPFNSNQAELDVVAPGEQSSTPVPSQTRGLGVVFLGVTTGGTSIEFFNGGISLGQVSVPNGTTSFAGLLFPDPVVTRVVVTLGSAEIFGFDGTTVTPGGSGAVAGDDVVLAEPAPARPDVAATAGAAISPVLDTFTNTESQATAVIDWGDGTRTGGTISPVGGGVFNVTGTHAYAATGTYRTTVTVRDFGGKEQTSQTTVVVAPRATATGLSCSPARVAVTAATTCVATVADAAGTGASAPSGTVAFSSTTPGVSFAQDAGCLLAPTAISGVASCAVAFTPGQRPPAKAHLDASYGGDTAHAGSVATVTIGVHAQRCSLQALSRRLRPRGLGVLVTCEARASLHIAARASVARNGRFRAFQLQFGTVTASVTAGRPTVLVIKPAPGVLPALRAALHHHQRLSLKLTLTASSHGTSRTTTTRVSSLRLS
jgi:hypothetical protein